jgi:hypothetical protein
MRGIFAGAMGRGDSAPGGAEYAMFASTAKAAPKE